MINKKKITDFVREWTFDKKSGTAEVGEVMLFKFGSRVTVADGESSIDVPREDWKGIADAVIALSAR